MVVASSPASRTANTALTAGRAMAQMSTSWKALVPSSGRATWPVMQTMGTESMAASASAVSTLVAPGPEVARQTAGRPVARAMPWAMKPAPCSWRASTWRMVVLAASAS